MFRLYFNKIKLNLFVFIYGSGKILYYCTIANIYVQSDRKKWVEILLQDSTQTNKPVLLKLFQVGNIKL